VQHTVASLFFGWLRHADRRRFEIVTYHLGPTRDAVTEAFERTSDRFHHLSGTFREAALQIGADAPDVLVYLDLGMASVPSQLAALRLAPVQCVAWGHPVTSGLPTIDYFLSAASMEPRNAGAHYTETVVRLPGIGVAVQRPGSPATHVQKSSFGLPAESVVYCCAQSPFKYLPQHDRLIVEIARRVPRAHFVLTTTHASALALERRLRRAFRRARMDEERVRRVPRQSATGYLGLLAASDVFLDTVGWNGGHTTLEAVALGLPVITWPGRFMRSRHSAGILNTLGVTDTIAGSGREYVRLAVRAGTDPAWRRQISRRMRGRHAFLYDRHEPVRALEEFYRRALRAAR
jgi:predicted O-linked N-acetylglucosamine transferase (SPINDLY family)